MSTTELVEHCWKVFPGADTDAMHRWDTSRLLLDPYAPLVKGRAKFAERDKFERYQDKVSQVTLPWHLL